MKRFMTVLVLVCLLANAGTVLAGAYVSTDRCGYTGTVTRYATLADAQAQTNPVSGPYDIAQRSAGLWFAKDVAGVDNGNIYATAWWYTTVANTNGLPKDDPNGDRYYSGYGNPENTNTGFVQLYDADGSTSSSFSGEFDSTLTQYTLSVSGANAGVSDYARFWQAPGVGGAASLTKGVFVTYDLAVTFGGLNGAYDSEASMYIATDHPDSVTGAFSGIFQNTNTTDPNYDGYYRFTQTLNMNCWALDQGDAALNGDLSPSEFASTVPEPATMSLLALGGLAMLKRRKA